MKKILTALLAAALLVGMTATVSAADAKLEKSYAEAADGDLLFTVDFSSNGGVFVPGSVYPDVDALANHNYTVEDGGKTMHITGRSDGTDAQLNIWGAPIEGLPANSTTTYTMLYKVRANGNYGKNNSIGVGGWLPDGTVWQHYSNYGNHNTLSEDGTVYNERRTALSTANMKVGGYVFGVQDAYEDEDGYITMMMEFNGPEGTFTGYVAMDDAVVGYDWKELETQPMEKMTENDTMCMMFYVYYNQVDHTVSDVRFFKGIGLSAEQLNYDPNAVVETVEAAETAAAGETVVTAPQTFDMGIVAAACAIVSAAGYALTKKR